MSAKGSFYVDAPVETVFDYLKTMKWLDASLMEVSDVKVTEDGAGTSFRWSFKVAGLRFKGFDVFTEVIPNQRITERSEGTFAGTWVHTFQPEGTGTRWTIELRPGSFWRIPPLNMLLEFGFARMGEMFVPRFKESVEALSGSGRQPLAGETARAAADGEAKAMKRSIHIEAPVEKVFDYVFDSFKDPVKFHDQMMARGQVDEMKTTKEGTGTYISWHAKIAGVPIQAFEVLTDVVPGKHITERSSSATVGTWDFDFAPEGSGTKLTIEHHMRALWRIPPLHTLMDLAAARPTDSLLLRLKDTIEAPVS